MDDNDLPDNGELSGAAISNMVRAVIGRPRRILLQLKQRNVRLSQDWSNQSVPTTIFRVFSVREFSS